MMVFWVGCDLFQHTEGAQISLNSSTQIGVPSSHTRGVFLQFGVLYAVGFITKVYLFQNHLFSYTGSVDTYMDNLAPMQVLNYVARFGTLAFIISTTEL